MPQVAPRRRHSEALTPLRHLAQLRRARHVTQARLAREVGISIRTLRYLEACTRTPTSIDVVNAIARALAVRAEALSAERIEISIHAGGGALAVGLPNETPNWEDDRNVGTDSRRS